MRNLVLLGVLLVLLTVTYFLVERKEYVQFVKKNDSERLYDPDTFGDLKGIKLKDTGVIKAGSVFYTINNHIVADARIVDKAFKTLSAIKAKRWIKSEDIAINSDAFFSEDDDVFKLIFEHGEVAVTVGNLLPLSDEFYVKLERQLEDMSDESYLIGYSTQSFEGIFQKEHLKRIKRDAIRKVVLMSEKEFYSLGILSGLKIKDVEFLINGKLYTAHLGPLKTTPEYNSKYYSGYKLEVFSELSLALNVLSAFAIIPNYFKDDLSDDFFQIKLLTEQKIVVLRGYKKYKGNTGFYLTKNNDLNLYQLDYNSLKGILLSLEDFWIKKD